MTCGRRFSYMTIGLSAGSRNVQQGPFGISNLLSSLQPLDRSSDQFALSKLSTL